MTDPAEGLRVAARRHHLHYEVEAEFVPEDDARVMLGFVIRLWGVHERGARALPGCAATWEIVARLAQVARYALDGDGGTCAELEPFRPALYESRAVPGADEVALAIRIAERVPARTGSPTAAEERGLRHVRARLRALGVPEQ